MFLYLKQMFKEEIGINLDLLMILDILLVKYGKPLEVTGVGKVV